MTTSVTDEMVSAAARAIFIASRPKNMIPADWDNGALLGGEDDSFRHAIINQARVALEAALRSQGKVVSVERLEAFQAEFESSPVRRGQSSYDLGYFDGYRDALGAAIDLTAIIGEGD